MYQFGPGQYRLVVVCWFNVCYKHFKIFVRLVFYRRFIHLSQCNHLCLYNGLILHIELELLFTAFDTSLCTYFLFPLKAELGYTNFKKKKYINPLPPLYHEPFLLTLIFSSHRIPYIFTRDEEICKGYFSSSEHQIFKIIVSTLHH